MRELEHIESFAVTDEVAEYAAALRDKYYQRDDRALSYADTIHLAMAVIGAECDILYSGDPDFEQTDEIETAIL